MQDRSEIIDRIRKLLALATDNPNPAEAAQAAMMAQRLIVKNDVADYELMEKVETQKIIESHSCDARRNAWSSKLAGVVADAFRCQIYRWHYKDDTVHWVFVGYELDATAAKQVFDTLFEIGNRLAAEECRIFRRVFGTARGVKNSYLNGFVSGIRSELEKQSKELMVVRSKEVDEAYDKITEGFGTFYTRTRTTNPLANQRGFEDGRDSVRGHRMDGQKALT